MSLQQETTQRARSLKNTVKENVAGLNNSFDEIKKNPSTENITESVLSFLTMFSPVRDQAIKGARFMAGYTRRHPVRMAISAIGLGFLASRFFKSSATTRAKVW